MLVKDGLNLLNLTAAEVAAYDAGIFLDEGSLLYDTTNKQVIVYDGTKASPLVAVRNRILQKQMYFHIKY